MKEKQLVLVGTIVLMLAMALTGCDTEYGSSRSSSNNGVSATSPLIYNARNEKPAEKKRKNLLIFPLFLL